jgi:hypothetical protein
MTNIGLLVIVLLIVAAAAMISLKLKTTPVFEVAVKASLTASYRNANVRTAVLGATDYASALYTELQQALRITVSSGDVEALLANRAELGGLNPRPTSASRVATPSRTPSRNRAISG